MTEKMHKILFSKVVQASNYSAFILRAGTKEFAIYTSPTTGLHIENILDGKPKRPQTHSFIDTIFDGFSISIKKVIINDVKDNIYYSKILLSKSSDETEDILEIDARPSDSLLLALKHDTEVLCSQKVLDYSPAYID
ncbi:MAG: hypothetical protein S4CHLAM20_00780 [Chlamydiia bacterium]|nr:hypothetical protein [Chlamydiia bacterium]